MVILTSTAAVIERLYIVTPKSIEAVIEALNGYPNIR